MREAAHEAVRAWTEVCNLMEIANGDGRPVSKPEPSSATPSLEPAPAIDPWDGLDIPECLRRAPKAAAS